MMFRTAIPAPEPTRDVTAREDLIPLSHLALDLPGPAEGWTRFLAARGISFRPDRIGRDAVSAADAQRLLAEQRELELKKQRRLALVEQEAVERDERRRAQIWKGIPADMIPEGVSASTAMLQAAKDAQPRRRSMIEETLSGSTLTYHSMQSTPDGE